MSRSRRRFPLSCWVGSASQDGWKRSYNRAIRRVVRIRVRMDADDPDALLPTLDEMADPWDSPRDGTGHFAPFRPGDTWWSRDPDVPQRVAWFKAVLRK